jgi:acyl-CoA carboxylase epsilon subunit
VTPGDPVLSVVRGQPTGEEVAALTVALLAAAARAARGRAAGQPEAVTGWARRSSLLRDPVSRGPGGWRRSGLPGARHGLPG